MSEQVQAPTPIRTCEQASKVPDMREDWPRAEFFRVYDHLLARSKYSSSEAIAETAGFSPSNISRWRNGKSKPTPDVLRALANALGVEAFVLWEAAGILPPGAAAKLSQQIDAATTKVADAFMADSEAPPQVERLANLYAKLDEDSRGRLVSQLEMLIEWAEAALARRKT